MPKCWEIREEKVICSDGPMTKTFWEALQGVSCHLNPSHLIDLPLFSLFGIFQRSSIQPLVTPTIQLLHLV